MNVVLTWPELVIAAGIGMRRQIGALRKSLLNRHGLSEEDSWSAHVEGAAGEMAAARAMNRYYSGSVNTFKRDGDVGKIQVRTRSRHDYELLVRPEDRDGDVFVLVTGVAPAFNVVGWLLGRHAKQDQWLKQHGGRPPAYFVPHAQLHPIESLCHDLDAVP